MIPQLSTLYTRRLKFKRQFQYYTGTISDSQGGGLSKPQLNPQQFADLYSTALPGALGITNQQTGSTANALAGAAAGANPVYTASGQQQLQDYAPGYAQAGNNLSQQQAWNQANLLANGGGATAMLGAGLNQLLNPVQAAANRQGTNLLNSYNLNGLSPGEYNATERSLNQSNAQSGNLGVSNGMNTISNAMNFGGAFNNKLTGLSNALGNTTGVSANQQTQVNPVGTALGAGNTSGNFGLTQFNPTQANSNLTTPYSFGSSFGNQLAGVSSTSKSANANQSSSMSGGVNCCFIFLEAYKGKLPPYIRRGRNIYYHANPDIATGYRRMSRWLVPAMQQSSTVRWLVWQLIVSPANNWLSFRAGKTHKKSGRFASRFWLRVWAILGKGKTEDQYTKPWMSAMLKQIS